MWENILGLFPVSVLGFVAYETSVRYLDEGEKPIKEIGGLKYLLYLIVFGSFSAMISASFAAGILEGKAISVFLATIGGYAIPSTGRLALLSLSKAYIGLVSSSLGGMKDTNSKKPSPDRRAVQEIIDESGLEETYLEDELSIDTIRPVGNSAARSVFYALMGYTPRR